MLFKDENGFIEFNPMMQSDRYLLYDKIGIRADSLEDEEKRRDLFRDFTVLAQLIKSTKVGFKCAEYKVGEEVFTEWDQLESSIKCAGLVTSLSMRYIFGVDEEDTKKGE